jgi:hypothetical protein
MRLHDIITEDFWSDQQNLDRLYNPEAFSYKEKSATPERDSTEVVTKIKDDQDKFHSRPKRNQIPSNGFVGLTNVQHRVGIIDDETHKRKLNKN